jgi:integrase
MTRRRARGEGTIRKRADGRYEARATVGYDSHGRQLRKSVYARTEAEVIDKLTKLRLRPLAGIEADRLTVAEYLDDWLRYRSAPPEGEPLKPSTVHSYRVIIDRHVVPAIGAKRLAALRPLHVQRFLGELAEGGLSRATVRNVRMVLSSAFRTAVDWELIPSSPVMRPPRQRGGKRKPPATWSAADLVTFLEAASSHRLYALFYLAAVTGARRGELIALRLDDLDLEAGTLRIERAIVYVPKTGLVETEPKTDRGRRLVNLATDAVDVLRAHLERRKRERKQAAELWVEGGYLFPSSTGSPLFPRNVNRAFEAILKRADVPRVNLHGLRHTYASLALRSGLPLRELSDRLGHHSPAFTLSVYTHVLPDSAPPALSVAELTVVPAPADEASDRAVDKLEAEGGEPVN